MPFCPACRSEYREGFTRCSECDVELVAERPADLLPWKQVFEGDPLKADLVRAALESEGIETVAPDQEAVNLGWLAPFAAGCQRIYVRAEDHEEARKIVDGLTTC